MFAQLAGASSSSCLVPEGGLPERLCASHLESDAKGSRSFQMTRWGNYHRVRRFIKLCPAVIIGDDVHQMKLEQKVAPVCHSACRWKNLHLHCCCVKLSIKTLIYTTLKKNCFRSVNGQSFTWLLILTTA